MKRNTYITPEIKTCLLNIPSLMAGSYIEKGNTDGQGSGNFDAPAKDVPNPLGKPTTW